MLSGQNGKSPFQKNGESSCVEYILYKVVEGSLPAIPPGICLTLFEAPQTYSPSTQIWRPHCNHHLKSGNQQLKFKCFSVKTSAFDTQQYRNSLFVRTTMNWNHLDEECVCVRACARYTDLHVVVQSLPFQPNQTILIITLKCRTLSHLLPLSQYWCLRRKF